MSVNLPIQTGEIQPTERTYRTILNTPQDGPYSIHIYRQLIQTLNGQKVGEEILPTIVRGQEAPEVQMTLTQIFIHWVRVLGVSYDTPMGLVQGAAHLFDSWSDKSPTLTPPEEIQLSLNDLFNHWTNTLAIDPNTPLPLEDAIAHLVQTWQDNEPSE